jgi:hypothetical protein
MRGWFGLNRIARKETVASARGLAGSSSRMKPDFCGSSKTASIMSGGWREVQMSAFRDHVDDAKGVSLVE